MKKILLTLLCLVGFITINAETKTYTYDFSSNTNWVTTASGSTNVKTGSSNKLNAFYYRSTGECFNAGGNGYFNTGYFLWGKLGAYIELPTFDNEKITNITAHSSTGHSKSVTVNVLTSENDVASTEVKWSTLNQDYSYDITEDYQNSVLRLQVTNEYNSQLTSLTITTETIEGGNTTPKVAKPIFSVSSGTYYENQIVEIDCQTENATIYYTIDGTEPSDKSSKYETAIEITSDITLRAIAYAEDYEPSDIVTATYEIIQPSEYSYKLVTSIAAGYHYIIVGKKGTDYYAMSSIQNSNNRAIVSVKVSQDGIIETPSALVCEFETGGSEGAWSFLDVNAGGYLYAASSKSNYLRTQKELDDNGKASVEFGIEGDENVAKIVFQGENTRNDLRFNSQNTIFSCYSNESDYAKDSALPIYLYQRINDTITSVEDTMVDANAPVEYYNLQGVKVARPENGIFIRKQGGKATKVIIM